MARKKPLELPLYKNEGLAHYKPSTLDYDKQFLTHIGVLKNVDECLAWIDYTPLEESIQREIRRFRRIHFEEPRRVDVAIRLGCNNQDLDFARAFAKVIQKVRWNDPKILTQLQVRRLKRDDVAGRIPNY